MKSSGKWQTVTKRRLSKCWRMDLGNTIVAWRSEDNTAAKPPNIQCPPSEVFWKFGPCLTAIRVPGGPARRDPHKNCSKGVLSNLRPNKLIASGPLGDGPTAGLVCGLRAATLQALDFYDFELWALGSLQRGSYLSARRSSALPPGASAHSPFKHVDSRGSAAASWDR